MTTLRPILVAQFEAALSTLNLALAQCPDDRLDVPHPDQPFSQVVFHALIFTDVHLDRGEVTFRTQDFHRAHVAEFADYEELEDREPVRVYPRTFLNAYLRFVVDKVRRVLGGETDDELAGPSGHEARKFSRLELHLYSMRHVQHHAAQLGLRNQLAGGTPLRWMSTGWRE